MAGNYPLSVDELVALMREQEEQSKKQTELIKMKEQELKDMNVSIKDWEDIRGKIPTWQDIFLNADSATKRVLVNKLIERIDVKKDEVIVRFKINLGEFLQSKPRMSGDSGVPE